MSIYAIRHFEDGLAGAMLLHTTPAGYLVFDYPSQMGNPSRNELMCFELEGDCEAWLMANLETVVMSGKVGDGYTALIE
jgi:hypothetical protein